MEILVTFLEGLFSFISPCMLPLLPVYLSYFAGDNPDCESQKKSVFFRACFFVLGFTLIFCLLGVFAGSIGLLLKQYQSQVNIICGIVVILFGLSYMGVLKINIFKGGSKGRRINSNLGALIFGFIYAINLTPCIGVFLGSALMLAASGSDSIKGVILLLFYSLGLGLPFIISALIINRLKGLFEFIKSKYSLINTICGLILIVVGLTLALGLYPGSAVSNKDNISNEDISNEAEEASSKTEYEIPDFVVINDDEESVSLHEMLGVPTIVNFWATWCPPCQQEMPHFDKIYKETKDDINYIMVDLTDGYRDTVESAREFIDENGYSFPIYYDIYGAASSAYGINSIPTTLFINSDGEIVDSHLGALTEEQLRMKLMKILSK